MKTKEELTALMNKCVVVKRVKNNSPLLFADEGLDKDLKSRKLTQEGQIYQQAIRMLTYCEDNGIDNLENYLRTQLALIQETIVILEGRLKQYLARNTRIYNIKEYDRGLKVAKKELADAQAKMSAILKIL